MRRTSVVLLLLLLVLGLAVTVAAAAPEEAKKAVAASMRESTKTWLRDNVARIHKWGHQTNERYVVGFSERMKGK